MANETIGTAYVQIEPTTKGIQGKLSEQFGGEGEKAGHSFSNGFAKVAGAAGSAIGGVAKVTLGAITTGVAAGSAAVAGLATSATNAFGDYQQLVGGVETLFGTQGLSAQEYAKSVGKSTDEIVDKYFDLKTAQNDVLKNAGNAYQTAGLSANEYMETVTSFSASLIASLDGDTVKAAKAADTAIIDMADNANKMGTPIENIQNAYQGFAKQNYTMLDNLKLGYGGTKSEMERLLKDAQKISGVKYDLDNLNDVYSAIHVIQDQLGITGTTSREAATTLQGSAGMMKSAWENVIAGMGNDEADMSVLINNLVESVGTYADNLMPIIETALGGIGELITQLTPILVDRLPGMVQTLLPSLITAMTSIIEGLAAALPQIITLLINVIPPLILQMIPILINSAGQIVNAIVSGIKNNMPQIKSAGMELLQFVVTGLMEGLPNLLNSATDLVMNMVTYMQQNGTALIGSGIQVVGNIVSGILENLPQLIAAVLQLIATIVTNIIQNIPQIIQTGVQLIISLAAGLVQALPQLVGTAATIIRGLIDAWKNTDWRSIGTNIIDGIKNGISAKASEIFSQIKDIARSALDAAKSALGIHSPSKEFAWIGEMCVAGFNTGISDLSDGLFTADGFKNMTAQITGDTSPTDTGVFGILSEYLPRLANRQIVLDSGAMVGALAPGMDNTMGRFSSYKERYN